MNPAIKPQISNGEFTVQINNLKLWYKVSGNGPVCIHPTPGWGPSSELYFLSLTPLEKMFTMVYLDTRGSGRSQRPELNEYNMRDFVADIEGIRRHLGVEKTWLMGHSMGGEMALNYAFAYPNRVLGLVLTDTAIKHNLSEKERAERMQLRKGEPWFDSAITLFRKRPETQEEFDTGVKTILPFYFSSIENLGKHRKVFDQTSLSFHASQGQMHSEGSSAGLVPWLSEMNIPALIIVGMDDIICAPSASQFLHRKIPNSELLVIENAGHFPWMERPKQFFEGVRDLLAKLGYRV